MPEIECQTDASGDKWFASKGVFSSWDNMKVTLQHSKMTYRSDAYINGKVAHDKISQTPLFEATECPFCTLNFSSVQRRNTHVSKIKGNSCISELTSIVVEQICCKYCSKSMKTKQALKYHYDNNVCISDT